MECQEHNKSLDPEPLQKWAEESYAVSQITLDRQSSGDRASVLALVKEAEEALSARSECDSKDRFGLIGAPMRSTPLFSESLYNC